MTEHDEKAFCKKVVLELLETLTNRIELNDDFLKLKEEEKISLSITIIINLLGNSVVHYTKSTDLSIYERNARYIVDGLEDWFRRQFNAMREEQAKT